MGRARNGAELLCRSLAGSGVSRLFGVPGTQTIAFWEALRRQDALRPVVASNELAAAFMANGYARASGSVGVVATIPGPGFTFALTGLAEARLDSVPLLHLAGAPARSEGSGWGLQAIPQAEIAAPLVKRVFTVEGAEEIPAAVVEALECAAGGEPGPVLLQVPEPVLRSAAEDASVPAPTTIGGDPPDIEAAVALLAGATLPVILCGQGAAAAAEQVGALAETLRAPVITTTSGRGVVSEAGTYALPFDAPGAPSAALNELVAAADLVVALGAKLSHNGSLGYALRLPRERLLRVDASGEVLAGRYAAEVAIQSDVGAFLDRALPALANRSASTWDDQARAVWRQRLAGISDGLREPGLAGTSAGAVFDALREAMPDEAVVATDSGLHQYLTRRHLTVLKPRTLLVPTDFQSMGFGIPAAIGAAVATGGPAVAVVGDGGFALAGLELATAVRDELRLVVLVFVDGSFGLIRLQQLRRTGHTSGIELPAIELSAIAAAVGARYARLSKASLAPVFEEALTSPGVTLIEVPVDAGGLTRARLEGLALSASTSVLGDEAMRQFVRRFRS